jgi:hypothetical protein
MIINKYKNKILCLTSTLFFLSFIYFLLKPKKNIHECILCCLLLFVSIFSILFWLNPKPYCLIHRFDSVFAKTTFLYFILYTLFYKKLPPLYFGLYIIVILAVIRTMYKSHCESSKEWLSDMHIKYHSFMHLFCFIGILYAF